MTFSDDFCEQISSVLAKIEDLEAESDVKEGPFSLGKRLLWIVLRRQL